MMILTAKVDFKKIMMILLSVAALILVIVLCSGQSRSEATSGTAMNANDSRVKFLRDFGWEVSPEPKETTMVKIPQENNEVFRRYNALQKGQGYDLSKYAGKKVMRFVYPVKNYPGSAEPVYATVLVYKNQIIGGDITDTSANGKICGFQMPPSANPSAPAPSAESTPEGTIPGGLGQQ